jgi:hypothetical protein
LPFPQFATSGQKGFLTTASVPNASTGSGVNVNFVSVVTPAYLRYN